MGVRTMLGQFLARLSLPLDGPSHPSHISPSGLLDPCCEKEDEPQLSPPHPTSTDCVHRGTGETGEIPRRSKKTPPSCALDGRRHSSYLAASITALSSLHISAEFLGHHDSDYIYQSLVSRGPIPSRLSGAAVDRYFLHWLPHLHGYTAELLRLEGCGDIIEHTCGRCSQPLIDGAGLRCDDCSDTQLYCTECCVVLHQHLPLHRIQHWTGDHFQPVRLKSLGLHCQLGHVDVQKCAFAIHAHPFVVLDVNGIHEVSVFFCGCEGAAEKYVQLLRQRWWPATFKDPWTVATFQLLDHFDVLCGQSPLSPLSASDYYRHLVYLTDNVGVNPPPDRLFAFEVMVKQWQRVKVLEYSGTLHGGDVASTAPSGGVIGCPACLRHPGEKISEKSSSSSWARRLQCAVNGQAVQNCSKTIRKGSKETVGRRETKEERDKDFSVRVVTCPHGLKHARVVNRWTDSYIDHSLPHASHAAPNHDPARNHTNSDSTQPPCIFTEKGDAESCRDELDGIFGTWNRCQVVALPATLIQRAKEILSRYARHSQMYDGLNKCIPAEFTDTWLKRMAQWDKAPGDTSSPLVVKYSHLTESEVRQELRQQGVLAFKDRRVDKNGFTVNQIVVMGLDLEEDQQRLHADVAALTQNPMDVQNAELRERQEVLRLRIAAWHEAEQKIIPALASLRPDAAKVMPPPQTASLLLPSVICSSIAFSGDFLASEWRLREAQAYDALAGIRGFLQVVAYVLEHNDVNTMASDTMGQTEIVVVFARAEIRKLVVRYRDAYNAMVNLSAPLGDTGWRRSLRELDDSDVRFITEGDANGQLSWIWNFGGTVFVKRDDLLDIGKNKFLRDGKWPPPICLCCLIAYIPALRSMWCQARARMIEGSAERDILLTEMDRSAAFHDDQGKWWEGRVNLTFADYPQYLEGANAYAYRQASIRRALEMHCSSLASVMRYWFSGGQIPELSGLLVSLTLGGESSENDGEDNA